MGEGRGRELYGSSSFSLLLALQLPSYEYINYFAVRSVARGYVNDD